ncbi:MAG: hypothetical protein ABI580_08225 [Burkholderiaceae bacterium]
MAHRKKRRIHALVPNPNWRDADDYPDRDSTSLDRWASEFLWRNADFQRARNALPLNEAWSPVYGWPYNETALAISRIPDEFGFLPIYQPGRESDCLAEFPAAPYPLRQWSIREGGRVTITRDALGFYDEFLTQGDRVFLGRSDD